jgi:RNA 2',3'-cyclic 3'-phosphodiesterase
VALARRLFFALWPDDAWSARLIEAAAPVLDGAGGRALARVDLHLTLCFLGAVDEAQRAALCVRAGQIEAASFELDFERLELWRQAGIVAATVARVPAAAVELAQRLATAARAVGLTPDPKPWRPHLTLMRGLTAQRLAARASAGQLAADAWPALHLRLPVVRFYLAESQGLGAPARVAPAPAPAAAEPAAVAAEVRRYARLASWPLRP